MRKTKDMVKDVAQMTHANDRRKDDRMENLRAPFVSHIRTWTDLLRREPTFLQVLYEVIVLIVRIKVVGLEGLPGFIPKCVSCRFISPNMTPKCTQLK